MRSADQDHKGHVNRGSLGGGGGVCIHAAGLKFIKER